MKKISQTKTKQSLITIVTANYVDLLVPEFVEKSFESYQKKDFTKKYFQVSVIENAYATAGIVLTLLALEAYRNRIFYLDKKTISRRQLAEDISGTFRAKDSTFPEVFFTEILTEITIVRDVIVHNHLYKVEIINDGNWDMICHTQKLLDGYGNEKRKKSGLVVEQTRKTKNLKLNVQPGKIGFEDLFKVLVIFDLFVGISNKLLTTSHVPFHFSYKFNGDWISNLSHFLSYYYANNPNKAGVRGMANIFRQLRSQLEAFVPNHTDYFIDDVCPTCGDFGFHQPQKVYKCVSCGLDLMNS